jgi:hypothetical protein
MIRTEVCHHPPLGLYVVSCTEGHAYKQELCAACATGIAGRCFCGRAVFVIWDLALVTGVTDV